MEGSVPFPTPPPLPLVMGGDGSLGDGCGIVAAAEGRGLVRGFIILEELGRETWVEFLGCREVLPAVVEFVETDSGCFPFDFDEIEVKFRDVGGSFGYQVYISNHSEGKKEYINLPAMQAWAKLDKGYRCTA